MESREEEMEHWKKLSSSHRSKTNRCVFHVLLAATSSAFSKPDNRQKKNSIQNNKCWFKSDS